MRSPVDEQLLLDLPDLEVVETSRPTDGTEVLRIGTLDTTAWPVDVCITRRRYGPAAGRSINLGFAPEETPGDYWTVKLTPEQARYAAARAAEETPDA